MQGERLPPPQSAIDQLLERYPGVARDALLVDASGCRCGKCKMKVDVAHNNNACPDVVECGVVWSRAIVASRSTELPMIARYLDIDLAERLLNRIEPRTDLPPAGRFRMQYGGESRTVETVRVTDERL